MSASADAPAADGEQAPDGLIGKAKKLAGDTVKHATGVVSGPSDGSRSASGAGAPGYVDNAEADQAVADLDDSGDVHTD